jgi:hypothetical protein
MTDRTAQNRHYRNEHLVNWVRVLDQNGGSLLIKANDQPKLGLYHLGALWARERGYLKEHGTVDVISHEQRRYAYTLTDKGRRLASRLKHDFHYDHHRAGMMCVKCGRFVSDFA